MLPLEEKISYDERTNQIVWEVGSMAAGTGILNEKRGIAFQVEVTPQENQAGEALKLLNESTLTAKDLFTGLNIEVKNKEKNTEISEDTTIPSSQFSVLKTY
jgi:hypothetical protein